MLIVERFSEGWAKAHIAAAMGISRKCVRTWIARYEAEGEVGLHDRSSRPHTTPTRTPAVVEDQIMALRRVQRWGPDAISAELGVPARTVSRVLRRRGVPYLRHCDPMTGELIRASNLTWVMFRLGSRSGVADLRFRWVVGLDLRTSLVPAMGLGPGDRADWWSPHAAHRHTLWSDDRSRRRAFRSQ
jgi:transposase